MFLFSLEYTHNFSFVYFSLSQEVVAVVQHEVRVSEDAAVKEVGAPVDEMKNPL